MHERYGAKSRLCGITEVDEPRTAFTDRKRVCGREFHEQVVRMLGVDDRLSFVSLSGLKQEWRTARRKSKRLKTKHSAQLHCAATKFVKHHRHEPILRLEFRHAA